MNNINKKFDLKLPFYEEGKICKIKEGKFLYFVERYRYKANSKSYLLCPKSAEYTEVLEEEYIETMKEIANLDDDHEYLKRIKSLREKNISFNLPIELLKQLMSGLVDIYLLLMFFNVTNTISKFLVAIPLIFGMGILANSLRRTSEKEELDAYNKMVNNYRTTDEVEKNIKLNSNQKTVFRSITPVSNVNINDQVKKNTLTRIKK